MSSFFPRERGGDVFLSFQEMSRQRQFRFLLIDRVVANTLDR
jgi:hypothetical protein